MRGFATSYIGLFDREFGSGRRIKRIEIPLIQRDYAQGRDNAKVGEIREEFLSVLLDALSGGEPVSLDFVYGDITDGLFRPLDGQQRLTTLFLLHWYLASATGNLRADAGWARFSYATRPGARLFCERLVENPLPDGAGNPSLWIVDQPWYQYLWDSDPTVSSMLVMLDAIDQAVRARQQSLDPAEAWTQLTDASIPAISFYLLPLGDMDSAEELYIKMNSRGKPLTEFENFKAIFEQDIAHSPRAAEFACKVDGAWADLLWPFENGNDVVDDEFVRYFDFITEICEMRDGNVPRDQRQPIHLGRRARTAFGKNNPNSARHLDFLFDAFDTWGGPEGLVDTFQRLFRTADRDLTEADQTTVTLFGVDDVNLVARCLRVFGNQSGTNREFSLGQTLLLYAVLLHRIRRTEDFQRRVRVVRNLVEASTDEIRRDTMPQLLRAVDDLVTTGDLDQLAAFSGTQIADEKRKAATRQRSPDRAVVMDRLEDHPLLRGTLTAFDTDAVEFCTRAETFPLLVHDPENWSTARAALLATGDYQGERKNGGRWHFGSSSNGPDRFWRELLTSGTWERMSGARDVLGTFLTGLARSGQSVSDYESSTIDSWLDDREANHNLDWRYYLVKYPSMQSGDSGYYFGAGAGTPDTERDTELGYSIAMLRGVSLNGYYRDPILLQIYQSVDAPDRLADPWFIGQTRNPRWLRLTNSSTGIRSVAAGFHLAPPNPAEYRATFDAIVTDLGLQPAEIQPTVDATADGYLLPVPQTDREGRQIDTEDRTVIATAFIQRLLTAGL